MKQDLPSEPKQESAALPAASGGSLIPIQGRALKTRAALLRTVEEIVTAEGMAAVTTTRVAEQAGVSVGSLYRYFKDRDALVLAAYDATVARIIAICAETLAAIDENIAIEEAARRLLDTYLDAANAIPAHAGLLKAMRGIRTVEADQTGSNEVTVIGSLIAPFMEKFAPDADIDSSRLHFMNVLIGNLVDLYLITPGSSEARAGMRREIEAHVLLALERSVIAGNRI